MKLVWIINTKSRNSLFGINRRLSGVETSGRLLPIFTPQQLPSAGFDSSKGGDDGFLKKS